MWSCWSATAVRCTTIFNRRIGASGPRQRRSVAYSRTTAGGSRPMRRKRSSFRQLLAYRCSHLAKLLPFGSGKEGSSARVPAQIAFLVLSLLPRFHWLVCSQSALFVCVHACVCVCVCVWHV